MDTGIGLLIDNDKLKGHTVLAETIYQNTMTVVLTTLHMIQVSEKKIAEFKKHMTKTPYGILN
ncbi:MAG: hypothetical protein ACLVI9_00790 [Anaerostipes hadrus]